MNMQLLHDILTCYGPSGSEGRVAGVIARALEGHADSVTTDVMGNLIAVKKGKAGGKRIMFSAHMDHIALAVIDADKNGFLRVCNVGGIYAGEMPYNHVAFGNGVCGVIGADEDVKGDLTVSDLYIDIGAASREEALSMVALGDMCVVMPRVTKLGEHRLSAPAMDDRIACYVLLEAMLALGETDNEIAAVFSVQEEVGLRGATTAAYTINPDMGIAIDVTGTGDVPKAKTKLAVELGKGAAVKIMDRSLICTPAVVERMEKLAREKSIPVQREVLPYGGTDAGAIQKTRGGVPSGAISIPCRYIHSGAETVDLRDVKACIDLTKAFMEHSA
ncbi:MAG: M20/M25/M40 family metallo-hydrolase [Clostridia bacterium]|nr:M20/M25/M40 family metallo-hydrolase [Clostridia bacterium]